MHSVDTITLIGGFGILLFSLRFLTGVLRRSIGRRFRPILMQYLSRPFHAFAAGFLVTALVQASSITIVTTMSLLSATLITLEQGIFVMLGATMGTTLKFWLFAGTIHLGRLLVGVGSMLYLLVRRPMARELLEVVIAVGFAFVGLHMMAQGVEPLANDPGFVALIRNTSGISAWSQFAAVCTGFALTVILQSSSAMLWITLDFATKGLITLPAGLALVLGLNVGTVVTPLLASAELDWRGRRLAVAHALVKSVGALVALFFLPTFQWAVTVFASPLPGMQLIVAHTLFNAVNAAVWVGAAGLLVRVLRASTPADPLSAVALAPVVRRMLASSPERALVEAERQLERLRQLTKALVDDCVGLLALARAEEARTSPMILGRAFDEVHESLQELLLQLSRSPLAATRGDHFVRLLGEVEACQGLYDEALSLMGHLQQGLHVDGHQVPAALAPHVEALARAFDGRWIQVVFPGSSPEAPPPLPTAAALAAAFHQFLRESREQPLELLAWLQGTFARLGRIAERLDALLEAGALARGAASSARGSRADKQ